MHLTKQLVQNLKKRQETRNTHELSQVFKAITYNNNSSKSLRVNIMLKDEELETCAVTLYQDKG